MKAFLKISALAILIFAFSFSIAIADLEKPSGNDDLPVICTACATLGYNCTIAIGGDYDKYPGQSEISIPVTITTDTDMSDIDLYIQYGSGITLDSISFINSDWSTDPLDFDFDIQENPIRIQFAQAAGRYIPGDEETYTLFEFWFTIDEDTDFDEVVSIYHNSLGGIFPQVDVKDDYPDGGFCRAYSTNGGIATILGQAWFEIGEVAGYSYQHRDYANDSEKDTLIYAPVYFHANFPVDYFKIGVEWDWDIRVDHVGFVAADGINAFIGGTNPYRHISDNSTYYEPSEDPILIGYLTFQGHDAESDYNSSNSYSRTDVLEFWSYANQARVDCAGSNIYLTYDEINKSNGAINYPVYTCDTYMQSTAYASRYGIVDILTSTNHTFWAQGYEYKIQVDDDDLPDLTAISMGSHHPGCTTTDLGSGDWRVEASGLTGKYILPGAQTIFKLRFDVDSDFFNDPFATTSVDFNCVNQSDCWTYDFFQPDGDKIYRDCEDEGYFDLSGCTVYSPEPELSAGSVEATPSGKYWLACVPINVDWVNSANEFDTVRFKVEFPSPYFDSICIGDDYTNVSWSYSWPSTAEVFCKGIISPAGDVDSPGELLKFWFSGFSSSFTVYLSIGRFYDGGLYRIADTQNGSVNIPKLKISPDIPNPDVYQLSANYPNPFNATTTIKFNILQTELVTLDIYNVLGQKVITLVNEQLPAGSHSILWKGTNSSGDQIGSGFYFYKLTTPNFTQTRKMLLLK